MFFHLASKASIQNFNIKYSIFSVEIVSGLFKKHILPLLSLKITVGLVLNHYFIDRVHHVTIHITFDGEVSVWLKRIQVICLKQDRLQIKQKDTGRYRVS